MNQAQQFRRRLEQPGIIVAPGACTPLMAKIIEDEDFEAVYVTGAGVANMQFGFPDMGLVSMSEHLDAVKRTLEGTCLPAIVDIDTGYGNQLNVYRTVREFSRTGAAVLQMEDQVAPKKCGHFTGKQIVSVTEMVSKIQCACDARLEPAVMIMARTDAIAVEGFDAALDRARAYVEAGADMIFVEAPGTEEQMEAIPRSIPVPTVANMVEGGRTPLLSNKRLEKMGFKTAIYANGTLKAAVRGMQNLLRWLKEAGTTAGCGDLMISMEERNRLTEMDKFYELERKYASKE